MKHMTSPPEHKRWRPALVFFGFGVVAALPHLAIFYVLKNRVLPLLGIDWSEAKFADNELVNMAAGAGSLVFSAAVFIFACRLSHWRSFSAGRWVVVSTLYLLPAAVLYLLPWII
jgi:hypothetical protein